MARGPIHIALAVCLFTLLAAVPATQPNVAKLKSEAAAAEASAELRKMELLDAAKVESEKLSADVKEKQAALDAARRG